jgi:hypothetical protein
MSIRNFVKWNRLFSIATITFLVWITFLIVLSIIGKREVIFLDALDSYPGTDVSSDYASKIPFIRYLIEPLVGIAFLLGYDFEWMIAFVLLYFIYRIIYLVLKRNKKFTTEKFKKLKHPVYNFMSFVFKAFSLALLAIALIMLIGYLTMGYYFVSRFFMVVIQLGIRISMVLLLLKIIYLVLVVLSPQLKFKHPSKMKKNSRLSFRYSGKIKKELIFLVGTLYLLLGVNIILIATPFPTHNIYVNLEDDEFLFDFHIHSTMSDGYLTPEQRVDWYITQGISGAAFTDHDNIRGAIAKRYVDNNGLDFVVWIGEEWTDNYNDIHMNYYGLEEEIVAPMSETPSGIPVALNASDMINYVKSKGGYVIVNHYNYDLNPLGGYGVPYTLEQLSDWGVDGFEIVNGDHVEAEGIRNYCLNSTNVFNESLICFGGSDIHTNEDIDAFIKLKLDDPTNKTIDNVFKNLRNNTHSVITLKLYSDEMDFPDELNDLGFELLEDFLNYLLNLDLIQSISWILWSSIAYVFIFLLHRKVKKN